MSSAGFPYTDEQRKWWFATHPSAAEAATSAKADIGRGDLSPKTIGRLYEASTTARKERLDALVARYTPDNPFAERAALARMAYEQLTGHASASDAQMAQSFPVGGGFSRKGYDASIDRTVKQGVATVKADATVKEWEGKAKAFDEGRIDSRGRAITRLDIEEGVSTKTGMAGFFVKGIDAHGRKMNVFTEHRTVAEKVRKKLVKGQDLTPEDLQP